MQWLAELCVKRPVFATVLILSLTVVGAFSFSRLGVDRFPKVDFPTILVTTAQPGAAPEQIETEITDKIEEAVNTISGIDELRSTSSEGISQVVVSFVLEKDTDVAAQEVRDKVNSVLPLLPKTIQQPRVEKMDPDAAPVLSLALSANKPIRDITEYADKVLRRQLESLNGVGQVLILGGRQRQVNIWLDADRLRAYNVTVTDVSRALQGQNTEIPGGRVDQGPQSLTLRTRGRVQSVPEFNDIVVRETSGHPVRIADVASVEDGEADADTIANVDGSSTVLLQIRRQSGTNTVEVVDNVLDRVKELQKTLPPGYTIRTVRDSSEFIKASIHNVEEHLIVGSILAALVVLLFLANLRSTIISAIAIPTSIIATFGLIWYMDFTLNSMTMLALTLSVGIVIDDAIVVLENIYRFIEEKHDDHFHAAIDATKEIGLAVLATTLSLVAIFVPVGFMGGIVGRFMKSFGLTMAFAIMVSLLVSFTLTPMLSARWLKVDKHGKDAHSSKESKVFHAVDAFYTRMLNWAMDHRLVVSAVAVLVLLSSVPLFMAAPKNFIPNDDQSEFEVNLRAPEGTSLEQTEVITNRVATAIRQQVPEVAYTLVTIGGDPAQTRNLGNIYVRLRPIEDRRRDQFELMGIVRKQVLPGFGTSLRTSVQPPAVIGGGGAQAADVQFIVNGPDLHKLEVISQQLKQRVSALPGVVDADTSLNVGKPELAVQVDRPKAADMGVQISDAAEALRLLVGGDQVSTYFEGGEQYEVHLRAQAQNRTTQAAIGALTVPSSRLGSVSLDNVADFAPSSAPSDINRLARQRQVTVFCNLLPSASQSAVQNEIQSEFAKMQVGSGYSGRFTGRSRELGRAAQNFVIAFLLSLVFMYLILAAQFESWLHPITILLSLPLTLPFALLSIILFRQSLNIFSALGLLVLFGVVKKNSILQIDHANQLKETGLSTRDAIVQASRDRLRPILMTTFAFVAGMIPLIASQGIGAGTNHAIGFIIFGGQSLALLLTLLVTPVAYSLFDQASRFSFARLFAGRRVTRGMLEKTALVLLLSVGLAASARAQTAASAPETLRLSIEDAVKMAMDANVDLKAARLDPQISDTSVAAAAGVYRPSVNFGVNSNNQLIPPSSFLFPFATTNDVNTTSAGVGQQLPWFGTSYSVSWNAVHTNSNSILNGYNPLLQSGLGLSISQPLLRNLKIDFARTNLATTRINRDIADTRLRETLVHTEADVKTAYWNLVTAHANVEARQSALDLAQELVRVNKAKVDVGTAPPLDLVSAQAEVASDQEQLIIAETAVKIAEDRLRMLITDPSKPENWNVALVTTDSPPIATASLDLDAAVARALRERADLARSRKTIESDKLQVKYTSNQKLPDVRVNASYTANGLGGTQVLRSGGFPGTIIGSGSDVGYGTVLNQLFAADYPTWVVGLNVSYPIGQSTEQANAARARLQQQQGEEQLKSAEANAIQQIRNAYWQVDMNAKRIDTTRAARELAEQRLDAERKRLDVGMSTSFLVIQAQRDLAQARTNELSAILSYDLSLVAFDELQQAGPSQQNQPGSNGAGPATPNPSIANTAAAAAAPTQTPGTTAVLGAPATTPGNPQQ
ncbi:MAG TPA: efflux RND transporter permease subunit [Vicinamibacterales bacterium]|nr:efflux RND transporter permease subunit [Vicinamibacterales bacterium]